MDTEENKSLLTPDRPIKAVNSRKRLIKTQSRTAGGQAPQIRKSPNLSPSQLKKATRQICHPVVNQMNTKKRSAMPYLEMEYRKTCPSPTCSQLTFREPSVMDAGATSSILPLKIALDNNFNIIKPKKKISLTSALGQKLSVQGIASIWTKAKDSQTYRLVHFIVSRHG